MFIRTFDQPEHPFTTGGVAFCLWLALSATAADALAQSVTTTPPIAQSPSKSSWQSLTPAQQLSLMPLASNWNSLGESNKRKWIAIAANYPRLSPAEQEKLHSRMSEWVSLSQQQREQARLNFAESKRLTPTQKAATWQAYQALSPEEKQKLAAVPVTKQKPKQLPKLSDAIQAVNRNTLLPHVPDAGQGSTARND
jgi:hypothetical protein